jgi:hypothetical protein
LVAWLVLFVVASAALIAYITLVTLTMILVVWALLAVVVVAASKLAQEMRQGRSVPRDWYRHIAALHHRR